MSSGTNHMKEGIGSVAFIGLCRVYYEEFITGGTSLRNQSRVWPRGLQQQQQQKKKPKPRNYKEKCHLRKMIGGLPTDSVVNIPPANVGDMVQPLIQEDPTCCGATKPAYHNYWACDLEPQRCNTSSPHILEPGLCNEKSQQWESHTTTRE